MKGTTANSDLQFPMTAMLLLMKLQKVPMVGKFLNKCSSLNKDNRLVTLQT